VPRLRRQSLAPGADRRATGASGSANTL
jgi:hypothetical protein